MTRRKPMVQRDATQAVAYLRVSTDRQDLGLDAQREAIGLWASARGIAVDTWHEDRVSGGADTANRPGLLAALGALSVGRAGWLVVAKRDRLARERTNAGLLDRQVQAMGARVATADGMDSDPDDPLAVAMTGITDVFSELERGMIRARTRAALRLMRSRGQRFNGTAPYGWQVAADGRHLEPQGAEATAVALVVEWRAQGTPLRTICAWLANQGLRPRSGGQWHPNTVARIAQAAPTGGVL